MFLRNWYKALTAELYSDESVKAKNTDGTDTRLCASSASGGIYKVTSLTMAGKNSSLSSNNNVPYMGKVQKSYSYGGVILGTGDTAPSIDDYKLSGDLITTISAIGDISVTQDDNGCTFEGIYSVTNSSSEDVTVKEIGLLMTGAYSGRFLVERTVLDTPVTIPAGGIGQVTYTIRMNYPTV